VRPRLIRAADIIFLGSGCYGSRPGEAMIRFIEENDFKGRKVALFGAFGGGAGLEVVLMAAALKQKGAAVLGSYRCKGKAFLLFSYPDQADLEGRGSSLGRLRGLADL
jgi:flavodoxin